MTKHKSKLKAWIEVFRSGSDTPSIRLNKPTSREIENAREFGYVIYPCIIIYDKTEPLK